MRRTQSSGWVEKAARAGYAAKGVIYGLIGGLAIASVVTATSGGVGGSQNAVQTIGQQPFGQVLLVLIGLGLFGYALWRFIQSYYDPENEGDGKKGAVKRVGYAISGVIHAALGVAAFQMVLGSGGGSGSSSQTYFGKLLAVDTFGQILAYGVGIAVLGFALYQAYEAVTHEFADDLKTHQMSEQTRKAVFALARAGLAARALVFTIIGAGVLKAAANHDPSQVDGVGGALHDVASQPFGAVLLVIVAAGLAAYGAFQLALSKYRQIPA